MSRGGIIIKNRSDGRGIMLPEREGRGTFNKLPFISVARPKQELGINPISNKIIVKTKKLAKKYEKNKKKSIGNKLYPLEHYRKIKTSEQFWKKNENEIYKEFNKKDESKENNQDKERQSQTICMDKNNNPKINNDSKNTAVTLTNNRQKLKPINLAPKNKIVEDKKNNGIFSLEQKEEKVNKEEKDTKEIKINNPLKDTEEKNKDENKDNKNDINDKNNSNSKEKEEKEEIEEDKEKKEIKELKDQIKEHLFDGELDEDENIDDIISYLTELDYDKYCKDMQIREALTLLKSKMDKEQEKKDKEEEKNKNKVTVEGSEQTSNQNAQNETEEKKVNENEEKKDDDFLMLPDINKKNTEKNPIEIVDEEMLKKKEEIKKYKIAEQIAKTDKMKAIHSANSIKRLLEREGLDKIDITTPLKLTVIKENQNDNSDELEPNKIPFLHSIPKDY